MSENYSPEETLIPEIRVEPYCSMNSLSYKAFMRMNGDHFNLTKDIGSESWRGWGGGRGEDGRNSYSKNES